MVGCGFNLQNLLLSLETPDDVLSHRPVLVFRCDYMLFASFFCKGVYELKSFSDSCKRECKDEEYMSEYS